MTVNEAIMTMMAMLREWWKIRKTLMMMVLKRSPTMSMSKADVAGYFAV